MAAVVRLGARAHGRGNNFQLIRLLAAISVVVFHCYALTNRWTDEPLWKLAPELDLGTLGVKCFFVVSGFLVTQSWLTRRHLAAFAWARALRIYPALIAATLLSAALAWWSSVLPVTAFAGDPQTLDYVWRNALGWEARDRLPGAYATNPFPHSVNGSLWTLPIELRLYIALAIAGMLGMLGRRAVWTVMLALLVAFFAIVPDWYPLAPNTGGARAFALCFVLGSLACVWRDAIPLSVVGLIAALALIAVNPGGVTRTVLFEPLLAYVLLTLAYHPALQWPAFNRVGDYSYGLYLYSFPVQQTLVRLMPGVPPMLLLAAALPVALGLAALSWHLLEQPALGLKSRFL